MGAQQWFFGGVVVLLVGCVVPGGGSNGGANDVSVPEGKGQLVVKWKGDPADKAVLGTAWASATADAYELALVGPSDLRFFDLAAGSGQVVAVDPGTYRVLILAGVKRSSGSATAYLVGTASADAVTVALGQRTPVELSVKSVDLGWSTSGPAYWKSPLTVFATGKSRNSWIGMSLAGASTTTRPRFKSIELWNGYKEVASVTGTPDDWAVEASGTVPDAIAGLTVGLVGAGIQVQILDGTWVSLAGLAHHSWYWPNRPDLADTHPLAPFTEFSVTCAPPPTGVEVSLGWE